MDRDDHLDEVFKALADPTRRRLLDALRRDDGQTVGQLCAGIDMARQSVTQHLDLLVAANLVTVVRRGRERRSYLNPEPIHAIQRRWIREFDTPRLDALAAIKARAEEADMPEQFPDFVYVTYISASVEAVWSALTDPEATLAYWGGKANVSDYEVGATWTHREGSLDGEHHIWGRILEADPPRRLVHTFQPAAQPLDQPGSVVTFDLVPADGVVQLTVTHTDLPDRATYDGIAGGWPTVLAALKTYLETGDRLPDAAWRLAHA